MDVYPTMLLILLVYGSKGNESIRNAWNFWQQVWKPWYRGNWNISHQNLLLMTPVEGPRVVSLQSRVRPATTPKASKTECSFGELAPDRMRMTQKTLQCHYKLPETIYCYASVHGFILFTQSCREFCAKTLLEVKVRNNLSIAFMQ
jgi:hypothetical protein